MAAPATIIGQIPPTPVAPGTVSQVAGSPSQMQIGQPVVSAQAVPLPATVPQLKQDGMGEVNAAESSVQNAAEVAKENGMDGKLSNLKNVP